MKRIIFIIAISLSFLPMYAQTAPPDTIPTGIYITSIHDIDFKEVADL